MYNVPRPPTLPPVTLMPRHGTERRQEAPTQLKFDDGRNVLSVIPVDRSWPCRCRADRQRQAPKNDSTNRCCHVSKKKAFRHQQRHNSQLPISNKTTAITSMAPPPSLRQLPTAPPTRLLNANALTCKAPTVPAALTRPQ